METETKEGGDDIYGALAPGDAAAVVEEAAEEDSEEEYTDSDDEADVRVTFDRDALSAARGARGGPTPQHAPVRPRRPAMPQHDPIAALFGRPVLPGGAGSIYDLDLDSLGDKPWMRPGADPNDFFNFNFNESRWRIYAQHQKKMRAEAMGKGKIETETAEIAPKNAPKREIREAPPPPGRPVGGGAYVIMPDKGARGRDRDSEKERENREKSREKYEKRDDKYDKYEKRDDKYEKSREKYEKRDEKYEKRDEKYEKRDEKRDRDRNYRDRDYDRDRKRKR
eukprot:TRINITY_DN4722_c0_g1_i7.p1 TRINITY_DN4722_c0_g1~~TRINITY_DN4722_c0_g1_i7.p1  ORF type:complete len:317 (+),score=100.07 TRINITY_DN4722_c0_g1_i7:109-951(+)